MEVVLSIKHVPQNLYKQVGVKEYFYVHICHHQLQTTKTFLKIQQSLIVVKEEDTTENAEILFEEEVRQITEPQKEYELDQLEQADLIRDYKEYELAKIAIEAAEKKLKVWGHYAQKYYE
ncbi:hypothetical protein TVAG_498230 [Trichomonas vaginalis G3]|uniref:Uncharacterized protein n=1 Tax=Trichomonas vaginalis (strain ATCC PRA-98 / G3) TaxID=412133 RepID=A2FLF3_TRIV3|nr:hypothetical protein TVAGG3_0639030 [Trichomonas vaginalis G3]EAX94269.1 hypothetical protein TVAG_498230 [Trichomonas vaginalis G3]KAI5505030.1 hypothetical protein TVAGG3_0639030 [Trichomonas vaginalis G3]|eukprot:XP_001307199.1 hypothetical protein [Trichomonas vaginalis G3]